MSNLTSEEIINAWCAITHTVNVPVSLNVDLINKRKITLDQVLVIIAHQQELNALINKIAVISKTRSVSNWHDDVVLKVREQVEKLEYKIQQLWGFKKDKSKHTRWMDLPGCLCDKHLNQQVAFTGAVELVHNLECPWHGCHHFVQPEPLELRNNSENEHFSNDIVE